MKFFLLSMFGVCCLISIIPEKYSYKILFFPIEDFDVVDVKVP